MPRLVVEAPPWLNTSSASLCPSQLCDYRIHVLLHLTMQAVPITSLPDLAPLTSLPLTGGATTLVAGRRRGQTSPAVDWVVTDGSFAAFHLFLTMRKMRREGGGCELRAYLQALSEEGKAERVSHGWVPPSLAGANKAVTWSWGAADFGSNQYT